VVKRRESKLCDHLIENARPQLQEMVDKTLWEDVEHGLGFCYHPRRGDVKVVSRCKGGMCSINIHAPACGWGMKSGTIHSHPGADLSYPSIGDLISAYDEKDNAMCVVSPNREITCFERIPRAPPMKFNRAVIRAEDLVGQLDLDLYNMWVQGHEGDNALNTVNRLTTDVFREELPELSFCRRRL